jgi:hypothetical protein
MHIAVERLTAILILVTALSHVTAAGAWARLFERIRASGETAGLLNAFMHLPLGAVIVVSHDVWTWPAVIVTVFGWALVIKGTLQLLFPALAQRSLALAGEGETAEWRYRTAGVVMFLYGLGVASIAWGYPTSWSMPF